MTPRDLHVLGDAIERIVGDVGRARGLLGDAMQKLFQTFLRLREHLALERTRYERAIEAINGSDADQGLVAVVRDVVSRFVDDIVRLSHASVRILLEVDQLQGHAEAVAMRGARIDRIAQTTRVISLNARIEAQRTGEAGAVFRVVADEIKALAAESSDLSRAIRGAVEAQAQSLAKTRAAANLLASTELDRAVASHHGLDDTITKLVEVAATSTSALTAIQADIDAAIGALQFEDMLDQLLGSVSRKLGAVRQSCNALAAGGAADLHEIERDAVKQQDVSTGSVELF